MLVYANQVTTKILRLSCAFPATIPVKRVQELARQVALLAKLDFFEALVQANVIVNRDIMIMEPLMYARSAIQNALDV